MTWILWLYTKDSLVIYQGFFGYIPRILWLLLSTCDLRDASASKNMQCNILTAYFLAVSLSFYNILIFPIFFVRKQQDDAVRWMIAVHYWPIWIRGLLKNNCSGKEVSSIKEMSGKFQDKKIMQKLFRILLLQTAMIINTGKQTWHISFNFAPTKLTTKVVALVEIQAWNLKNSIEPGKR